MVATNAHIGNYGVNENEVESDGIKISGLVCKISVSITLELIPLKV
jgi:carbamoylphosphate synthase small subunit